MTATLSEFATAYVRAMLWAETDDAGRPLEDSYSADDFAPETLARIVADCDKFYAENEADITAGPSIQTGATDVEYAGHDFWLTRNGHGCGFWDGDWPDDAGERLTASAKRFGQCYVYVGDDGNLYF